MWNEGNPTQTLGKLGPKRWLESCLFKEIGTQLGVGIGDYVQEDASNRRSESQVRQASASGGWEAVGERARQRGLMVRSPVVGRSTYKLTKCRCPPIMPRLALFDLGRHFSLSGAEAESLTRSRPRLPSLNKAVSHPNSALWCPFLPCSALFCPAPAYIWPQCLPTYFPIRTCG